MIIFLNFIHDWLLLFSFFVYGSGHTHLSLGLILALCSGITPLGARESYLVLGTNPGWLYSMQVPYSLYNLSGPLYCFLLGKILIFSKHLYRVNFLANNIKRLLRWNIPSFPYVLLFLSMIPSWKFILTFRHTTNLFKKNSNKTEVYLSKKSNPLYFPSSNFSLHLPSLK